MLGVHVGTPMYGGLSTGTYVESLVMLTHLLKQNGVDFGLTFTYNESLITRARNRIVDAFLKGTSHTHLLWSDADIGFVPADVMSMLALDLDIVGAACPTKSINWRRICATVRAQDRELSVEELMSISGDFVVNFLDAKTELKMDQPKEVARLGTGLLLVKREVFLRMREAFPDRYYTGVGDAAALPGPIHAFFESRTNPETREYLSEDYAFCDDARSLGMKVWLAPWVRTTHTGNIKFEGNLPAVATIAGMF